MKKNDIVNISMRKLLEYYSFQNKNEIIKWVQFLREMYKCYIVLDQPYLSYVVVGCIGKNVKGVHYTRSLCLPPECLVPYKKDDVFIDLKYFV